MSKTKLTDEIRKSVSAATPKLLSGAGCILTMISSTEEQMRTSSWSSLPNTEHLV